jgi:hypothetical protein
MGVEASGS